MKQSSVMSLLVFVLILTASVSAQIPDFSDEVKEAMSKLSVLNGNWEGDGWAMSPMGEKSNSHVYETFTWKLDNTVLMIEGLGVDDSGKTVHNALATVFYDPRADEYRMQSHLATGMSTDALFEVLEENKKFQWTITTPGATIVYVITIENDVWFEEGSYSREGMPKPMKFFEMTLKKK